MIRPQSIGQAMRIIWQLKGHVDLLKTEVAKLEMEIQRDLYSQHSDELEVTDETEANEDGQMGLVDNSADASCPIPGR